MLHTNSVLKNPNFDLGLNSIDKYEVKDELMVPEGDGIKVKNQRRLLFNDFEDKTMKYQIKSIHETDNSQFNRGIGCKNEVYEGFTRVKLMNPPKGSKDEEASFVVNKAKLGSGE